MVICNYNLLLIIILLWLHTTIIYVIIVWEGIMINIIVNGEYIGCKIKRTYQCLYIELQNSQILLLNSSFIFNFEILYTDNKNRFSVKFYFRNKKTSLAEIDKRNYHTLIKSFSKLR